MTARWPLVLVCLALASGCGPRPVATETGGPALIVLLPEPDGRATGHATVSNALGSVDLDSERESVSVLPGQAPPAVVTLSDAEVDAIFSETLNSMPRTPQSFVLHFRFESDELTDESRALLPQVLEAVVTFAAPEVVAVGHTDTTGDERSNIALGLDRANAVRGLLIGAGLDASLIEVTSHGEADLLVKTPDETAEPRNRRVEIAVR
jgi:outer membrane protein OmpA-like peptidoglycan-associated protein